jgi:hypothetical protein
MAPSSLGPTSKRRKVTKTHSDTELQLKELESQLSSAVQTKGSLNPLSDLLEFASSQSEPDLVHKAIYALYRVFVMILGNAALETQEGEDTRLVRTWIFEKLNAYAAFLLSLLKDSEPNLRVRYYYTIYADFLIICCTYTYRHPHCGLLCLCLNIYLPPSANLPTNHNSMLPGSKRWSKHCFLLPHLED